MGPISAERFDAQLLTRREARSAQDVVGRLLAVQAQDPRGARLAVRSRSVGLLASGVDRALSTDRSLVIGWLNRWTLHLVLAEDYWWLHALTTPQTLPSSARRLAQEGVDAAAAERALDTLRRALVHGPLSRAEIGARLASADVPTAGQAVAHLLRLAAAEGILVRGPVAGGPTGDFEQHYVLAQDWLGGPGKIDRDVSLARLAERYLAGHGPAAERDLARWAGIPLGSARAGLRAIAGALADRDDGLAALAGRSVEQTLPPPRLLGAFDPLLLGWRSRADVLGPHEAAVVSGGVFRAFALVDGRAAGLWGLCGTGVRITPFGPLEPGPRAALQAEEADVERFLGATVADRDRIVPTP